MSKSDLEAALSELDKVEANLIKLETLWEKIHQLIPDCVSFGGCDEYDEKCRAFKSIQNMMPTIGSLNLDIGFYELDEIAQIRFDYLDIGEPSAGLNFENDINSPGSKLSEYRFYFNQQRRSIVRDAIIGVIANIDKYIESIPVEVSGGDSSSISTEGSNWKRLKNSFQELNTLLGSSFQRPSRWGDMGRHLHFGQIHDFKDIRQIDWPEIKDSLNRNIYSSYDPIPIHVKDIEELVKSKPTGPVTTELNWENIDAMQFERLVFQIISEAKGYENPEWLTDTYAPDRGRDLSVFRIVKDTLSGTDRKRVIIQCRHTLSKNISPKDIALLKEQMKLWEPPAIDIHIVATSGRFTTDAVDLVEKSNLSDTKLKIEMWPNTHLERLLASRPHIVGAFGLRDDKSV